MPGHALDSARELALKLPECDRAELAATLLASLDGPLDLDAAEQWEDEILRRLEVVEQGEATFVSSDDAIARARQRLKEG